MLDFPSIIDVPVVYFGEIMARKRRAQGRQRARFLSKKTREQQSTRRCGTAKLPGEILSEKLHGLVGIL